MVHNPLNIAGYLLRGWGMMGETFLFVVILFWVGGWWLAVGPYLWV